MNPISPSGATPPRCNCAQCGVLNNKRKRNRNEFEAGGVYQSELPVHQRPFGHRPQIQRHFNGLLQHASLNPPPLAFGFPQPSLQGGLLQQQSNNLLMNPPLQVNQPPQPSQGGLLHQQSNNLLMNPPHRAHQPPQPSLQGGFQQQSNNLLMNPPHRAYRPQQPSLQGGLQQQSNNLLMNVPLRAHQPPQPSLQGGLQQQSNNLLMNGPLRADQLPQPSFQGGLQQQSNNLLMNGPLRADQLPQPSFQGGLQQQSNNLLMNGPLRADQLPQPSFQGGLQQQSNNLLMNVPLRAHQPPQPSVQSGRQQQSNNFPFGSRSAANIPSPRGYLLGGQNQEPGFNAPPFNQYPDGIYRNNGIINNDPNNYLDGAIPDMQPHVQDNQARALDKAGDIVDWGHLWNLQVLLEDPDLIDDLEQKYPFQDWELPHLPDGGVPQQQPRNDLLFDDVPDNNPPYDGLLDIARWPDWDPLNDEQPDDDQSDGGLSQDGEDGLLEDNNLQVLQHGNGVPQQAIPPVMHNPDLKICDAPGCIQPTFHQTLKARKCRLHLENPVPQSRLQAPGQAATAGQDFCSGCNGLHPRRAPSKTCWECYCKGRGRRLGVCDGCPASRCPNRVVEGA